MKKFIIILPIVLLLLSTAKGYCVEPTDSLEKYIDRVVEVFKTYNNPNNSTEYKLEFEGKLVELAKDIFSFDIMSRMVLGRYWRSLSNSEQKEFTCLFIELLTQNYFDKILAHVEDVKKYPRDNIQIIGQILFSKRKAEVKTQIRYQDKLIPIDYRFVFINKRWKIYDVYVEGVSLIKNYRSQFKDLFLKKSAKEVIEELRKKLKDTKCNKNSSLNYIKMKILYGKCMRGSMYEN